MNLQTTLHIFPNTGYHFHFFPFPADSIQNLPDLVRFCDGKSCPWLAVLTNESRRVPWLRARFTSQYEESTANTEYGVLLAIDSNLGRTTRGWTLHPKQAVTDHGSGRYSQSDASWTPYAFSEISAVPKQETPQRLTLLIKEDRYTNPALEVQLELELMWLEPQANPIDVDLIVDFGNTRTVAIGLECNQAANGLLGQICRPIRFAHRSDPLPVRPREMPISGGDFGDSLIDSWFVLHEPLFSNFEPNGPDSESGPVMEEIEWETIRKGLWKFGKIISRPAFRTLRMPQMFTQLSPALLGPEASQILSQLKVEAGGNFFLSSPKRYLWDNDTVGHMGQTGQTFWTMYPNRWTINGSRNSETLKKLSGSVLRFLDENGTDWFLGEEGNALPPNERLDSAARPVPNPDQPAFPRADALTWAALTVLEASYRNINSAEWRRALGQPSVKRRLRSVTVTFPPGWTGQELDAYRRKWQKALDIFALTQLPDRRLISQGGDRPLLVMDLDEAVASQLPLVFSEIKRLGNEGENWIELIGRGQGTEARARIMNIDIGGGTTDVAIIEYADDFEGPGVQLTTTLLYRDSSTIAGDALVRRIIEAVLLPLIAADLNPEEREAFQRLISSTKHRTAQWRRLVRQVFIPIVYQWLQNVTIGSHEHPETKQAATVAEILEGETQALIGELNQLFSCVKEDLVNPNAPLNYNKVKLEACITETFFELFRSLSKPAESFDCDLVLVSGKPSELPQLRPLLEECLPFLPQRLIFAKDAPVGSWFPMTSDGRIQDAKTVTVAGAALNQAVRNGLIPQWQIKRQVSKQLPKRNYWGLMPQPGKQDFGKVFLEPKDDKNTCSILIGSRIGRRLLPSKTRPEPVYIIRWRDPSRYRGNHTDVTAMLKVTLHRIIPEESQVSDQPCDQLPKAEHLEIADVDGSFNGAPVTLADIELRLCTIDNEDYWMESCIFHPEWPESA